MPTSRRWHGRTTSQPFDETLDSLSASLKQVSGPTSREARQDHLFRTEDKDPNLARGNAEAHRSKGLSPRKPSRDLAVVFIGLPLAVRLLPAFGHTAACFGSSHQFGVGVVC